ncbi:hypothetical protein F2P81_003412 [Scophthalmus maximus]|uniref:Uncharacterized protein n=1 Tax=Scophthalmus maximus TaxID=52904 RepID=A0A6A4TM19_SCOMX|nr:hypothetical protein F2P81_003412 [Scophthalmus maximus]
MSRAAEGGEQVVTATCWLPKKDKAADGRSGSVREPAAVGINTSRPVGSERRRARVRRSSSCARSLASCLVLVKRSSQEHTC